MDEMITIGVDGCKSGWVAAIKEASQNMRLEVFPDLVVLWDKYGSVCSLLLLDMPIGLIDNGPEGRICDHLARRMLSPRRHSSIFTPPSRAALYVPEAEASIINFKHTGKKLSRQTINIMPKMREVDLWMRQLPPESRHRIKESHPEVVFTALNSGLPLIHNKKKWEGQEERLDLLEKHDQRIRLLLQEAQTAIQRKVALTDDLIDAMALGIAARMAISDPETGNSLPVVPPLDREGLAMEIFFAAP